MYIHIHTYTSIHRKRDCNRIGSDGRVPVVLFSLYIHTQKYIYIYTHTHIHIYIYFSLSLSIHIYTYTYVSLSLSIYIYMQMYIYIHVYMLTHIYVCVYREGGCKTPHVTCMNESCHTCGWVMSRVWMRLVTHMIESRLTRRQQRDICMYIYIYQLFELK